MEENHRKSRRSFVKKLASTVIASASPAMLFSRKPTRKSLQPEPEKKYSVNDKIQIAVIGLGIMGFKNLEIAQKVAGVKLIAGCDLYDGHLERLKEGYGKDIFTTRSYQEILARPDVDAVIIATPDHWHDRISIEAMNSGKAVYCEKPMVHHIEEGKAVIETQKTTGQVFQVGSQRVSSLLYAKAKELYEAGAIGQLILVESWEDRQSSTGAWNYSIPPDASPKTVDWDRFQGDAPKRAYDPLRFFRWRNYQDYGTGVAGDLFVHLFSGIHVITSSLGPERIFTTGGLRYWKDGRDVPDVMIGCFDYPETPTHPAFNLQLRVNFISGTGGGSMTRLVGSEGVMEIGWNGLSIKQSKMPAAPGYGGWDTFGTFTEEMQASFKKEYDAKYTEEMRSRPKSNDLEYNTPKGYSDYLDHHKNFFAAIREDKTVVEDAAFGLRAAAPSLAANKSFFEKKPIYWDPIKMKLKEG